MATTTQYEFPKTWEPIASVDESEPYEVDRTEIYFDNADGTFVYASASGCSCWEGEYDYTKYNSLWELEEALGTEEDERRWHPTLEGVKTLKAQIDDWSNGARLGWA